MYGLRYATFIVPVVKSIQEQQQMIDNLKSENAILKAQLSQQASAQVTVEKEIAELKSALNALVKTSASIK
jgi:hypothetical protein